MKRIRRVTFFAAVLAAGMVAVGARSGAMPGNSTQDYAFHAPLKLAAGAPLQRLLLPADVLIRLQSSTYNDVRVFNAEGQSVPMALAPVAQIQTETHQVSVTAYPIVGGSTPVDISRMSLRIEEQGGKRMVQIESLGAPNVATTRSIAGALLDVRAISAPVVALVLDVDLPVAQPIAFDIQASRDLKNWTPLTDTVLYRASESDDSSARLGTQKLSLAFNDLKDSYLRITWKNPLGEGAPTVRGATLTTSQSKNIPLRPSATLAAIALTNPYELSFVMPFTTPLAALQIKPQGPNVLIPVRLWGRNDHNQAWTPWVNTVLYNLVTSGKEQTNAAVEMQGAEYREIKIEADQKTAGFAVAPQISVQFEPTQVVFLASGTGPFTVATGLAGAVSGYLPLASLIPNYHSGQENALPQARVEINASAAPALAVAQAPSNAPATRSVVLWAVLLLGVAALGLMAWVLMKKA